MNQAHPWDEIMQLLQAAYGTSSFKFLIQPDSFLWVEILIIQFPKPSLSNRAMGIWALWPSCLWFRLALEGMRRRGPELCPMEVTSCSPVSGGCELQRWRKLESREQGHREMGTSNIDGPSWGVMKGQNGGRGRGRQQASRQDEGHVE